MVSNHGRRLDRLEMGRAVPVNCCTGLGGGDVKPQSVADGVERRCYNDGRIGRRTRPWDIPLSRLNKFASATKKSSHIQTSTLRSQRQPLV